MVLCLLWFIDNHLRRFFKSSQPLKNISHFLQMCSESLNRLCQVFLRGFSWDAGKVKTVLTTKQQKPCIFVYKIKSTFPPEQHFSFSSFNIDCHWEHTGMAYKHTGIQQQIITHQWYWWDARAGPPDYCAASFPQRILQNQDFNIADNKLTLVKNVLHVSFNEDHTLKTHLLL